MKKCWENYSFGCYVKQKCQRKRVTPMLPKRILILVIIFLGSLTVYIWGFYRPTDSILVVHTAVSIINEGDTDLDEYEDLVSKNPGYKYQRVNGHIYSSYPEGTALVALPFCYIIEIMPNSISSLLINADGSLSDNVKQDIPVRVERLIASIVVALTAVVIYLIGQLFFDKQRYSLLLVFIFSFCTSAWSTASRSLWQHGPSMLMLSIALYLILLAKKRPGLIQFAGIPLGFAYVIRPTNSIPLVLLSIFVFIEYRKYVVMYILGALSVVIPFVIYNIVIYSSILPPYYQAGRIGHYKRFLEALVGNMVSPSRGLLIFVPIVLLSIIGIAVKMREKQFKKLDAFLVAIIICHWIVISTVSNWWGGYSYGPRFFTDMTPFFIFFLIPVISLISAQAGWKRIALYSSLLAIVAYSIFVHYQGALRIETFEWNAFPVDVDASPERVWDWRDPQILRPYRL